MQPIEEVLRRGVSSLAFNRPGVIEYVKAASEAVATGIGEDDELKASTYDRGGFVENLLTNERDRQINATRPQQIDPTAEATWQGTEAISLDGVEAAAVRLGLTAAALMVRLDAPELDIPEDVRDVVSAHLQKMYDVACHELGFFGVDNLPDSRALVPEIESMWVLEDRRSTKAQIPQGRNPVTDVAGSGSLFD